MVPSQLLSTRSQTSVAVGLMAALESLQSVLTEEYPAGALTEHRLAVVVLP